MQSILSAEQALTIARLYYRPDQDYDFKIEDSPEWTRFGTLWQAQLAATGQRWRHMVNVDIAQQLPEFTVGDVTATVDASFKVAAYEANEGKEKTGLRSYLIVVGCMSILAPVYTIYCVRRERLHGEIQSTVALFDPIPEQAVRRAEIIARSIEANFKVARVPHTVSNTPVPLYVGWRAPGEATLFHAFFTSEPDSCLP